MGVSMKSSLLLKDPLKDRLTWLCAVVVALSLLGVSILGGRVYEVSQALRLKSAENLHWAVGQLEVDHLRALLALHRLSADRSGSAPNFSKAILQFDILYSRVEAIVPLARSFQDFLSEPEAFNTRLMAVRRHLHELVPRIDALTPMNLAGIETVRTQLENLTPDVRFVVLRGMLASLGRVEDLRQQHERFLQHFFLAGGLVLLVILGLAAVSFFLYRTGRLRMQTVERLKTTLRSSFEIAIDAVVVADTEGRVVLFNAAAEALFEKPRSEVLGRGISTLWPMADVSDGQQHDVRLINRLAGQRRRRLRLRTKSGRVIPVSLSVVDDKGTSGRKLHVGFVRDISATVAVERRRRMTARRAKREADEKVRFLAAASHELRTPMQGVLGAIDLVLRQHPDAAVQSLLTIAQQSAVAALDQIEHVLDLTAIEDGPHPKQTTEPFSLRILASELVAAALRSGAEQGVDIRLQIDAAVPETCLGDPRAMRQMLRNLLSNAIKFGGDRPIFLRFGMTAQALLRIEVEDRGIGIDPADQSRIFEDFEVLDRGYGRSVGGAGIGLGIVRRAVQMMGGRVGVQSQPGRGSLFWVELPMNSGPETRAPKLAIARRVLVVDDQAVNRVLVRNMLMSLGHQAYEAADGETAVAMAGQLAFDLILMDISMPGMDGIEATRLIRAGGMSHQARIVGLTANLQPSDHALALGAGVNEIMYKPIRTRDLERVLSQDTDVYGADSSQDLRGGIADAIEVLADSLGLTRLRGIAQEVEASVHRLLDGDLAKIDPVSFAQQAHQCAGGAAIFGALPLHAALCELENAASAGDTEKLPDLVQDCRAALAQCSALIDAEIAAFAQRLPAAS